VVSHWLLNDGHDRFGKRKRNGAIDADLQPEMIVQATPTKRPVAIAVTAPLAGQAVAPWRAFQAFDTRCGDTR
jgi:hypothetical protein